MAAKREEKAPGGRRPVAFALRSRVVSFDGGTVRVLGGEWITHGPHVEHVRSDPAFRVLEVDEEELARAQAAYDRKVAALREEAAELGLVVFREGEVDPAKTRR